MLLDDGCGEAGCQRAQLSVEREEQPNYNHGVAVACIEHSIPKRDKTGIRLRRSNGHGHEGAGYLLTMTGAACSARTYAIRPRVRDAPLGELPRLQVRASSEGGLGPLASLCRGGRDQACSLTLCLTNSTS